MSLSPVLTLLIGIGITPVLTGGEGAPPASQPALDMRLQEQLANLPADRQTLSNFKVENLSLSKEDLEYYETAKAKHRSNYEKARWLLDEVKKPSIGSLYSPSTAAELFKHRLACEEIVYRLNMTDEAITYEQIHDAVGEYRRCVELMAHTAYTRADKLRIAFSHMEVYDWFDATVDGLPLVILAEAEKEARRQGTYTESLLLAQVIKALEWFPEDYHDVEVMSEGEVGLGFTMEQVRFTLGIPSRVNQHAQRAHRCQEQWIYESHRICFDKGAVSSIVRLPENLSGAPLTVDCGERFRAMLDFYASHSEMTDPGKYRYMYDGVTADIPGMVAAVQNILIHGGLLWAYGIDPAQAKEMKDGSQIRRVEDMLQAVAALDDQNLYMPRPPEKRLKVCCRHFAVLMCSLLRHQNLPARVVNGYATYTWGRGKYDNHWVCEYWDIAQQRWLRVDPQIDVKQGEVMKIDFNTLDVPAGKFVTGGEAWKLYRSGKVAEDRFGLGGKDGWLAIGSRMVRTDLVLEVMARNKLELLPWDGNDLCRKKTLDEQDNALLDQAAAILTSGDEAFDQIRSLYESNTAFRMPSTWTTTTPADIEGE